ncbi:putative uncharacterized protein [Eubacterium sp. CAG:248]|nr:putative uncharacterized protein [Eubacterium sp. CAG:248]
MAELKCPHCGQAFTVDDTELSSIVQQIRDKEFEKDIKNRISELKEHMLMTHRLEMEAKENEIKLMSQKEYDKEIQKLKSQLDKATEKSAKLQAQLDSSEDKKIIAVMEAVKKVEEEKKDLESQLIHEKDKGKLLLEQKDEQIAYYRDLKTKMSTKMVGETLEQHCEIQFNQLRATAFRNAYFEKDNDSRSGSKGDYIYRETDENGVELISIMFEMKNEMDETATKHKNEDFYKELDKDRKQKNCEYAVLVSMLESDNELFNAGIVDVSYKYEKMYVVRPQCFIPIITLLRNAAMNAMEYKQELAVVRNQNIDISDFEEKLMNFKSDFSRNYDIAHSHFDKAVDEIDKTIQHLEKVKKELLGSDNQLRIANNKVDEVSIKKLTRGNKTMQEKFEELKKNQ